ncbi:MAG: LD-carboxypeptidase [Ignavibacteria bacterium]|nr:MAG: LD-carboxypeptidase [Ignavibacteria bacterium]
MERRKFLQTSFLISTSSLVFNRKLSASIAKGIIHPPKLKKGDVVGLVTPGSYITEDELNDAKRNITNLGLIPFHTENVLAKDGYLAGSDELRAKDFNSMIYDRDVKAIWAVRGGYGCARILDKIDYNALAKNPKVVIGYSDITALLYGIFSQTGLVCFHGPVGISTFDEFSVNNLKPLLFGRSKNLKLKPADKFDSPEIIRTGLAEGRLVGGNLSLIISTIGTKYDLDYKNKIVFIEEINEEPYRIDRMLTHMIQAEKFDGAAGIALGRFVKCEVKEKSPEFDSSFNLKEVLFDRLYSLNIPVVYGLSFGHIDNKITLPFGAKAKLDVKNFEITLLENTVV